MHATALARPSQRSLRRLSLLALSTITVVVTLWLGAIVATRSIWGDTPGPIYTVAVLQAHLDHKPAAWLGRTLRIHAVAVRCLAWLAGPRSPCIDQQPALVDANDATMAALPLAAQPPPPVLAWLRSLPIIGRFAPPPHAIQWGIPADYTLQVQAIACAMAGTSPCYQALLQDVDL